MTHILLAFVVLLDVAAFAMPPQAWRNLATRRLNSYLPCLEAARPYLSKAYQGVVKSDGALALMPLPTGQGFYIFTGPALGSQAFSVDLSRLQDEHDRTASCYVFSIPGRTEPIELVKRGQGYVFREAWDQAPLSCYKVDQVVGNVMRGDPARASGATDIFGGYVYGALRTISEHFRNSGDQDPATYDALLGVGSACRSSLALTNSTDVLDEVAAKIREIRVQQGARTGIRKFVERVEGDHSALKTPPAPESSGEKRPPTVGPTVEEQTAK